VSMEDNPGRRGPGRPSGIDRKQVKEIIKWSRNGESLTRIAIKLNRLKVTQPGGGSHWDKWRVMRVLNSRYGRVSRRAWLTVHSVRAARR
jgi:Recombinase